MAFSSTRGGDGGSNHDGDTARYPLSFVGVCDMLEGAESFIVAGPHRVSVHVLATPLAASGPSEGVWSPTRMALGVDSTATQVSLDVTHTFNHRGPYFSPSWGIVFDWRTRG